MISTISGVKVRIVKNNYLNKISILFKLIRYKVTILIIITSFVCLWLLNFNMPLSRFLLVLSSLLGLFSGAYILNDYFDYELDKINAPHRPLPSHKIKKKEALKMAIICFTFGITLSIGINMLCLWLSVVIVTFSILYSFIFKKMGLLGNIIWALTSSCLFIYFGLSVNRLFPFRYITFFSFLFILSREILLDIRDIEGDRIIGRKTIPVLFGKKISTIIAFIIFLVYSGWSIIPYLNGVANIYYLILNSIFIPVIFIVLFLNSLFYSSTRAFNHLISLSGKMVYIGLLGFVIGKT